MKYVILIPDGAADRPIDEFNGMTVFEAAEIPNINTLCKNGCQGIVRTVPKGMQPGSDVAQMSLLGYDPKRFYNGRAPIEAVAQNINLGEDEWVFRCNLVTFADDNMADHSAGHISTNEGAKLISEIQGLLGNDQLRFYQGVSYRHLCVVKGIDFDVVTQPPHDIIGSEVNKNLPKGRNSEFLIDLMAKSQNLFENHEINKIRKDLGENPVSSIWLWGQGKRTVMESFEKKFGKKGAVITAVDLVRGLAKLVDFDLIEVEGATGYVDTNYVGKANAAIKALEDLDLVFIHVEGPDEAGHSGNAGVKKEAIEKIDKYIVGPVAKALQEYGEWRMLVMPDHPTPVATQGHTADPVPFVISGTGVSGALSKEFSEANAEEAGFIIENGFELMEYFLK